jgi:hypothetical protein
MTDWKAEELDAITQASELEIAALRDDGTLQRYRVDPLGGTKGVEKSLLLTFPDLR